MPRRSDERVLNGRQVAKLLGFQKVATVRALGEAGKLERRRTKGGHWRYPEASVRRYIDDDLARLRHIQEGADG